MPLRDIIRSLVDRAPSRSLLRYTADSGGIGLQLPSEAISNAEQGEGDELTLYQYMAFRMLEEEGLGEAIRDGVYLESESAVRLDDETRSILTLPEPWIGSFRLQTSGTTTSSDFHVALLLLLPNGDVVRSFREKGPLVSISESETYMPDLPQWEILSAVREHSMLSESERDEYANLAAVRRIMIAKDSGVEIDLAGFKDKNIHAPESVGLSVEEDEAGELTLIPSFGGDISPADIDERVGQISEEPRATSLRVRQNIVLLDDRTLKAAQEIIQNRKMPKHVKRDFFENPSAFLDTRLVDLDIGFSFRVKGIGPFRHGYVGETDESGLDWFERHGTEETVGATPASEPELEEILRSSDDLLRFDQRFADAIRTGASHIEFDTRTIDISDREAIQQTLDRLKQQFTGLEEGTLDREALDQSSAPDQEDQQTAETSILDIHLQDTEVSVGTEGMAAPPFNSQSSVDIDFGAYKRRPYPHQEEGIRWLLSLMLNGEGIADTGMRRSGALLADDMGLGKSFTTLVGIREVLSHSDRSLYEKPFLIVAPLLLLETWKRELGYTYSESPFSQVVLLQASADLPTYRIPMRSREIYGQPVVGSEDIGEGLENHVRFSLKVGRRFGDERIDKPRTLVVTTYQTLRDYQFSLCSVDWGMVVFDEAQNIKNPNALQTRAAKSLKAGFKILLTGTPVENHLGDFWCLMDTVQTGFLGHYQQFRREYIRPIVSAPRSEVASTRGDVGRRLRMRVGGYMLRRMKEDHLDGLPEKRVFVGCCHDSQDAYEYVPHLSAKMEGIQKERYDGIINVTKRAIEQDGDRGAALKGLQQLRDVSLHPDLVANGTPRIPEGTDETRKAFLVSGKLGILLTVLDEVQGRGEKAIIFAVNRNLQRFLSVGLGRVYRTDVNVINGDTKAISKRRKSHTRQSIIDQFQSIDGFGLLVMSPIAAGVGVTITAANNVIHLERHWNPAKESQATDRVYRIGQEKDVNVYVPILLHPDRESFDVNLNRLLMSKSGLRDAVISPEPVQFSDFVDTGMFGHEAKEKARVTVEEVQRFSGELFEALVAEIYSRDSDQVFVTPNSADRGCDVVVLSETSGNRLVQCKKTKNTESLDGYSPIHEIYASKPFFEKRFGTSFEILEVYTNARKFSKQGRDAAKGYGVSLKQGRDLAEALNRYEVTFEQLLTRNNNRISL